MSLLKYRNRLKTVKNLNSIFSALLVVTMVRTQKIKEKYFAMERYLTAMREVLKGRTADETFKKKTLLVITSNRGLCGNFNHNILAKAEEYVKGRPGFDLAVLGRNGIEHYQRKKRTVLFSDQSTVEKPNFSATKKLFRHLFDLKSELHVAYNQYRSTVVQVPTVVKLFPLPTELIDKKEPSDYILEPNPDALVERLYYHYIEARLFQIILNSSMGELGARFIVLKGAVDTSKDMVDDLTLSINKARQSVITRDLLEIISAAEALRRDYE